MAVIDPPGQPLSVPNESWRYCDTVRVGSSADAETAKQKAESPAMAHLSSQRLRKPSSRKVFKLLNHNLAWLLHRIFVARNDVKEQVPGNVKRLNYISCIVLIRSITRAADLYVHLAKVLLASRVIERKHTEG